MLIAFDGCPTCRCNFLFDAHTLLLRFARVFNFSCAGPAPRLDLRLGGLDAPVANGPPGRRLVQPGPVRRSGQDGAARGARA